MYVAFKKLMLQPWDESLPVFKEKIFNETTQVSEIVIAHLVRGGCDPDRIDSSGLAGTVKGCLQAQKEAPQQLADTLSAWRFCDLVESSGKFCIADRTAPDIIEIDDDELGAHDADGGGSGGGTVPAIKTTVGDTFKRPAIVWVRFYDPDLSGAVNEVTAHRQVADEPNESTIDLPIVSSVASMQAWAQMALDELWSGGTPVEISLLPARIGMAPGDVLRLSAGDFRVVDQTLATPGVITCNCMSWSANPYDQLHAPGGNPPNPPSITPVQPPDVALIDTVCLDADGMVQSAAGTVLVFALSMEHSARIGSPYLSSPSNEFLGEVEERAVLGTIDEALTVPEDISQFDFTQTTRVTLVDTRQALTTKSEDEVRAKANVALIGQHVVKFVEATPISDGVYDLSGFLFGYRGSEWATMPGGSKFVLLHDQNGGNAPGVPVITLTGSNASLSGTQDFIVHFGFADRFETLADNIQKNCKKALAPGMVRNETDGAGGTVLKFMARIRGDAAENAEATGAVPALTDQLTFDVVLMDGDDVLNTRRVTATDLVGGTAFMLAAPYSSAQLTTIYGAPPATISGVIYGVNGAGRGFGAAFELSL